MHLAVVIKNNMKQKQNCLLKILDIEFKWGIRI